MKENKVRNWKYFNFRRNWIFTWNVDNDPCLFERQFLFFHLDGNRSLKMFVYQELVLDGSY